MQQLLPEPFIRDEWGGYCNVEFYRRLRETLDETREIYSKEEVDSLVGDNQRIIFESAEDELTEEQWESGEPPCPFCNPKRKPGRFLVSLHETEDGPVYWWCETDNPSKEFELLCDEYAKGGVDKWKGSYDNLRPAWDELIEMIKKDYPDLWDGYISMQVKKWDGVFIND